MFDPDEKTEPDYSVLVIVLLLLPIFLLFRHFGKLDVALPACLYFGMICIAIKIRWDLREYLWFWITIILTLVVEATFIIFIPFPNIKVTKISLYPIGLANFFMVLGIVRIVEKLLKKGDISHDEE